MEQKVFLDWGKRLDSFYISAATLNYIAIYCLLFLFYFSWKEEAENLYLGKLFYTIYLGTIPRLFMKETEEAASL